MSLFQNYRLFFGLYSKIIATFWEFEDCHLDCVSFIDSPIVSPCQDKSVRLFQIQLTQLLKSTSYFLWHD